MSRSKKLALIALVALPMVGAAFVVQEQGTRNSARLFDQVLSIVSDRFVDSIGTGALYEKAARGLVEALDDPYSQLYTPKDLEEFIP